MQFEFMGDKGSTDSIVIVRQLQKNYITKKKDFGLGGLQNAEIWLGITISETVLTYFSYSEKVGILTLFGIYSHHLKDTGRREPLYFYYSDQILHVMSSTIDAWTTVDCLRATAGIRLYVLQFVMNACLHSLYQCCSQG